MSASPVFKPYPEEETVTTKTEDGAYYVAREDGAQIIIVGPMHFSPGDYLRALNDFLDTHYDLCSVQFMIPTDKAIRAIVMDRGFVSLIGKRN